MINLSNQSRESLWAWSYAYKTKGLPGSLLVPWGDPMHHSSAFLAAQVCYWEKITQQVEKWWERNIKKWKKHPLTTITLAPLYFPNGAQGNYAGIITGIMLTSRMDILNSTELLLILIVYTHICMHV